MKLRKKQSGGVQCASISNIQEPSCMPTPDVQMYVQPCSNLTENQFGMPGMPGLSLRGGRRRRVSKRRNLRGGNCSAPTADCFGNVPAPAIADGGFNTAPNASELAWFFRNSYGATPSTNVIPQPNINTSCSQTAGGRRRRRISRKHQRGGNYFFNLNQRVGGLPPVENTYQEHAPSFSNLQINSPNPADARVINIVPQNLFNGQAAAPRLDTSELTRNSMALSGGSRKKKSFLTRRSRNHLFGGSAAFPSAFNGLSGNFSPDMQTRQFDCNQPTWCPKCT